MQCPTCQTEAGSAEFCPKCMGAVPQPPREKPAEGQSAPAEAPAAVAVAAKAPKSKEDDPVRQLLIYGGVVAVVATLVFAAAEIGTRLATRHDPERCKELCSYGEVPGVQEGAAWQEAVRKADCSCPPTGWKATHPQGQPADRAGSSGG